MKFTLNDISVVVCNWMQTRFTLGAVRNIRKYYPDIKVIVVDDGSELEKKGDFNTAYAREAYNKEERFDNNMAELKENAVKMNFKLIEIPIHCGHGSALDYGLDYVKTPLILTMDNDIRLQKGSLVEEYLSKMENDVYAVGTTYTEPGIGKWIDPWFSLYKVAPIRDLHLSFTNFIFPVPEKTFHIGTGAFLHTMLTYDTLHRPKIWKAVYYPEPEKMDRLWHLKKFPDDKSGNIRFDKWKELIDG